ncbi:MAG: hypothetical protein FWE16_04325 [Firmicutes bacterium]|nr:hypothetical protein [Bacillota bacterium]
MNNQQQTNQDQETVISEAEAANIQQNKCGGCGANMNFDVASGGLKCGHCGNTTEFNDDEKVQRRQITADILKSHEQWTDGRVAQCTNCGAKEVLSKTDIATQCVFCGSAKIQDINEMPGIKPDSVIPFQITEQSSIDRFRKWAKSKFFAPKGFKRSDVRKNINKLYTPCWSFSTKTENIYNGTLGRTVTRTVGHGQNARTVTTTHWFRVSGMIFQDYMDVFYQSGNRITSKNFNRLKPFDLRQVKVYRQEYLSGIVAEHYSRTLEECFNEFSRFIKQDIRTRVIRKHRADSVSFLDIQTRYNDKRFNYVLLPLYITNYQYKDKNFNVYINGATGKVTGRYPVSGRRVFGLVFGIILTIGAAAALAYFLTR